MADVYIDTQTGLDSNVGTLGAPYKSLPKAIALTTRTAGDTVAVRNGRTGDLHTIADVALVHGQSGTVLAPITVEADYDDQWGDHIDLAIVESATCTPTLGSNSWPFTADVSGSVSVGDYLYVSGDDQRVYCSKVTAVSGDGLTITTKLPYFGANGGEGKTVINMLSFARFGTPTSSNRQIDISTMDHIKYIGIEVATNASECFKGTGVGVKISHPTLTGGTSNPKGITNSNVIVDGVISATNISTVVESAGKSKTYRSYLDNKASTGIGINQVANSSIYAEDCQLSSGGTGLASKANGDAHLKNCDFSGATKDVEITAGTYGMVSIEDENQVRGVFKAVNKISASSANPIVYHINSETTTVRTGGNAVAIKLLPSDNVNDDEFARLEPLELELHKLNVERTNKIFLKTNATNNWTANPTASELRIEQEFYDSASNTFRKKVISTGTLNLTGSTDWQALSVNAIPGSSGGGKISVLYGKPKEAGKSNELLIDPLPDIR